MNATFKPRVTMIVSHLAPTFGMEKVAVSLLKLLRTKYDVGVVCVGGTTDDLKAFPEARILGSPLRGAKRVNTVRRLRRLSLELEADLVIAVGVWVAVPWLLAARRFWRRTVVWEHSLMAERLHHSIQLRVLASFAAVLYGRARTVVAVSSPLEIDIRSICPGADVTTIPNPVEYSGEETPPKEAAQTKQPTIRLLSVGSLSKVKAQHLAIRAMCFLDDSFHLNIVGSGPELSTLERLALELGVRERVTFEGYLSADLVRKRMATSDLLVHTAVVETFGLVYVEAAEAGLGVVSTRTRVAEEMIPMYVPGHISGPDAASLALAILEYRSSPKDSDYVLTAKSRRRAKFSSETVLEKWVEILESPTVGTPKANCTRHGI